MNTTAGLEFVANLVKENLESYYTRMDLCEVLELDTSDKEVEIKFEEFVHSLMIKIQGHNNEIEEEEIVLDQVDEIHDFKVGDIVNVINQGNYSNPQTITSINNTHITFKPEKNLSVSLRAHFFTHIKS